MKFSPVLLLFLLAKSEEEDIDWSKWTIGEKRKQNSKKVLNAYLTRNFPNMKESDKKRYIENMKDKDAEEWKLKDNKGRDCLQTGAPHSDKRYKDVKKKAKARGVAIKDRYKVEKGGGKNLCCSIGKSTNKSLLLVGDDFEPVCDCVHKGEVLAGNNGLSCCSHMADEGGKTCGCIPPLFPNQPFLTASASNVFVELDPKDCCYESTHYPNEDSPRKQQAIRNDDGIVTARMFLCGKRKCASKLEKPSANGICCGGKEQSWDRKPDPADKPCGCTPKNVVHSKQTDATNLDCCSGVYALPAEARKCACIPANRLAPKPATIDDCCTGKWTDVKGNQYCSPLKCKEQGTYPAKDGDQCCVGTAEKKKLCGCLTGGVQLKKHMEKDCCSQKAVNGICTWLDINVVVQPWMTEDDCFSGLKDKNSKKCLCMPPSSPKRGKLTSDHAPQCCSKRLHKNLCACVESGDELADGAKADHCCSGMASGGECSCAPVGAPFLAEEGMHPDDCCSNRAEGKFCQCSAKNTTNVDGCCGKVKDKKTCGCIPTGHAIPTTERADGKVCCKEPKKGSCSKTCP